MVVDILVMIQNYVGPVGILMSAGLIERKCSEIPNVAYVKEVTIPSTRIMSEIIAAAGKNSPGVFGGPVGQYVIDEYRRGSIGNKNTNISIYLYQKTNQVKFLRGRNSRSASLAARRSYPIQL